MRRFVRRLGLLVGVLAILVIVFVTGVKLYLASPFGSARIAAQLEVLLGEGVGLSWADVGLRSTTLHGLSLGEAGSDAPWLVVKSVQVDVPFLDLIRGRAAPQDLLLIDADILLRFDRAGRLLTRFPGGEGEAVPLPRVHIASGRVTLRQDGRPDLVVTGLRGELHSEGARLVLTGSASDSVWGQWEIVGNFDRSDGSSAIALKTAQLHLTPALLDALPFVPAEVGRQVQAEGDTPVELAIRFDAAAGQVHYRVALQPMDARLRIAAINLDAEQVAGQITIEDHLVQLRTVTGRTAGGSLSVQGDLDWRSGGGRIQLTLSGDQLEVRRLPKSWSLPESLNGQLGGQVEMNVALGDGAARTSIRGQGTIRDVTIAGVPFEPIALTVGATGNDLEARMTLHDTDLGQLLRTLDVAPPFALAGRMAADLKINVPLTTPSDRRTYRVQGTVRAPSLRVADVELCELQAEVSYRDGILAMDELRGEVWSQPRTTSRCRMPCFRGSVWGPETDSGTAKACAIIGGSMLSRCRCPDAAGGQAPRKHGTLHHEVVLGGGECGTFRGSIQLGLVPLGELTARLTVQDLSIDLLGRLLPQGGAVPTGLISGIGHLRVRADRLHQLDAWVATASFTAHQLQYRDWTITDAAAELRLQKAVLSANDLHGRLDGTPLTGDARLTIQPALSGNVVLRFDEMDAAVLAQKFDASSAAVEGKLNGTVHVNIAAGPGGVPDLSAQIDWQSPWLRSHGIRIDALTGGVGYHSGAWDYHVDGNLLDGRLHLEGKLLAANGTGDGRVRIETVQLARLRAVLGRNAIPHGLRGRVDLDLSFHRDEPGRAPSGSGRFVLGRLSWQDTELADLIQGDLTLDDQQVRVRNLSGSLGGGVLLASGTYNLKQPERSRFVLSLQNAEADRVLAPWPDLAANVKGQLDVRVRSSIGASCRGTANVLLQRGSIGGIDVADWRWPIDFTFAPRQGRGQLDVRESHATVALGRLQGQASLRWGDETRLEGSARFYGISLRQLARSWSESAQVSGDLTGRIDFTGSNVRSVDDLTANVEMSMKQGQVLDLPVLRQLAPYIAPRQSLAAFQDGELQARLARGIWRVERLRLVGPVAQAVIEGTVNLTGRLDLNATANPGLLGGEWPLRLVSQLGALLTRRLVQLHITGTVRSPVVQVVPLAVLSEEATRFFLGLARR